MTDETRLAVVGSRRITDRRTVERALDECPWYDPHGASGIWPGGSFVSGGADGVDSIIEQIAREERHSIETIEPDWSDWSNGHPALTRNGEIVERATDVLAVWDGHSNGTRDTIEKALDAGTPLHVYIDDDE